MSNLRTAAQQALEFCEFLWREVVLNDWAEGQREATEATLRAALAETVEPVKQCMAHGECFGGECIYQRPAEPVQDPDSPERRCGGPGCDMRCCQPVQEPVAYSEGRTLHWHDGKGVNDAQLYLAPPQRKPLAEWQINDLMADIDPEDRDSWSFRQGVYAAEKHHGVRK